MKNLEDLAWNRLYHRGATIEILKGYDWNRDGKEMLFIRGGDERGVIAACALEWEAVQHDGAAILKGISDVIGIILDGGPTEVKA